MVMHRYPTASARPDGLLLLCGGRDANSVVSAMLFVGVASPVVQQNLGVADWGYLVA